MSRGTDVRELTCARAMALVHRRLDRDELDVASGGWLDDHLARCGACRQASAELDEIQRSLRDLPPIPLPEEALRHVWKRTARPRRGGGWFDWRAAAAAAVLAAILAGGLWYSGRPEATRVAAAPPGPTEAELERAALEARYVLGLASAALRRSERAAIGEVLGRRVAPALSKIPIEWPSAPAPRDGRRRKGNEDA